jgi:hypothetical protein
MSIFKNAFLRSILREMEGGNTAGSGGALGSWDGSVFSGDFYAPGDSRMPKFLGAKVVQRRKKKKKKKKKSRRKSKKK